MAEFPKHQAAVDLPFLDVQTTKAQLPQDILLQVINIENVSSSQAKLKEANNPNDVITEVSDNEEPSEEVTLKPKTVFKYTVRDVSNNSAFMIPNKPIPQYRVGSFIIAKKGTRLWRGVLSIDPVNITRFG